MNRALVLGGAGFLGSHLADALLKDNCSVIAIDDLSTGSLENLTDAFNNPHFSFLERDINSGLEGIPHADLIFNFACIASPPLYSQNQLHTLKTSSIGVLNALDYANAHHARLIQASTSEIYGDPLVHPQTESYWGNANPTGPRSCYDESKRFGEAACFAYHRERSTNVGVIRIFNTYGPRLNPNDGRVVSNLINQALSDNEITIYGDGSQTRSFCYVDDLIDAILRFATTGHTGPINLGNPHEISVMILAQKVLELTNSKSRVSLFPLPQDDPTRRCPDISLAQQLLDWEPAISLELGLSKTIDYYKHLRRR